MNLLYMKRLQVHPVIRDVIVTGAASLTNFLAGLGLIALFGHLLGVTLLGEYLLVRRVAGWLQPLAHLGLGVGVPRYVAYATEDRQPHRRQLEYFAAAVGCIVCSLGCLSAVLWAAKVPLGRLVFGDARLAPLVFPLLLLLSGGAAQVAVYGYYRGCMEMKRAGAMQICIALVPIISGLALFRTRSVALIVGTIGCGMIAIAAAFAVPIILQLQETGVGFIPKRAVRLLAYGVSRVPGDLCTGALLAVGPVVASHYLPVSRVSYLLVATSMLAAATVSTEPLGLVFLSKLSMMLAHNRPNEVRIYISRLTSAVLDVSVFVTIQLMIFVDVLIRAWVGPSLLEGITVIRAVLLAIPFYLFFTALRSAVDAGDIRPLNARNLTVALVSYVVMIGFSVRFVPREFLLNAIAIGLALAIALLALLTCITLTRLFDVRVRWRDSVRPFCCALALGGLGVAYHAQSQVNLVQVAILEVPLTALFVAVCCWSGALWVRTLSRAFRPKATMPTADGLSA